MQFLISLHILFILLLFVPQIEAKDSTVDTFFQTYNPEIDYISSPDSVVNTPAESINSIITFDNEDFTIYKVNNKEDNSSFLKIVTKYICSILYFCNGKIEKEKVINTNFEIPELEKNSSDGFYSKFAINPFSPTIPYDIKEVYTWDKSWNPIYNPDTYLQCTAFVMMLYALKGIRLKGRVKGDAKDWIYLTDTFNVYKSGTIKGIVPEVMDTVVWADNADNHAGLITKVNKNNSSFEVTNSNSTKEIHWYRYKLSKSGKMYFTDFQGRTSKNGFVPSHLLKLKPEIRQEAKE